MPETIVENIDEKQKKILTEPVFIVGAGRSGTTWLQKLLLENSMIFGGQETHFFRLFSELIDSVTNVKNDSRRIGLSTYWDEQEFFKQVQNFWIRTFLPMLRQVPEARVLLEKTPSHVFCMDNIKTVLPDAKFIHLIRDSRSVASSLLAASKGWGGHWASSNIKEAACFGWEIPVRRGRTAGANLSNNEYIEVHYEDLLENPVEELLKIYHFLGIEYNRDKIEVDVKSQAFSAQKIKQGTGIKTVSGSELKEPDGFLRKGQAASWKTDLNIFQKLIVWRYTRRLMRECGYNWNGRKK